MLSKREERRNIRTGRQSIPHEETCFITLVTYCFPPGLHKY